MRLYVRSADRRPDPEPLVTDERRAIKWMTAGWGVALVAGIVGYGYLNDTDRGWWVWTPPIAIALGLYGLRRLARQRR